MSFQQGGIWLRPMGLGDLLDETFKLYRRHFLSYVTIIAVVAAPTAVLSAAAVAVFGTRMGDFDVSQLESMRPELLIGFLVALVPLALLAVLAGVLSGSAAILFSSSAILGQPISLGDAYQRAFRRTFGLLGLGLLWLLAALAVTVGWGLLVVLNPVVAALSAVALVPIAIWVGLGWAVSQVCLLLDPSGPPGALGHSWQLVAGNRWRTLGTLVVMGFLVGILQSIPTIVPGLLQVSEMLTAPSPNLGVSIYDVLNALAAGVGQALFGGLTYITLTLLYYDLRVRKEAFDLERRADDGGSGQRPYELT